MFYFNLYSLDCDTVKGVSGYQRRNDFHLESRDKICTHLTKPEILQSRRPQPRISEA